MDTMDEERKARFHGFGWLGKLDGFSGFGFTNPFLHARLILSLRLQDASMEAYWKTRFSHIIKICIYISTHERVAPYTKPVYS